MTAKPNDSAQCIRIRGARVHNLQDIHVDIPRNALVVLTGVSGSGKSSLAFDTLFAEGQRRYLESLSPYTRQYLNQLERPDVDAIEGLPPTISVGQTAGTVHPRSTVATTTEIHNFLRLLYSRAGQAHCPDCGCPVSSQTPRQIVDRILELEGRRKVMILAPWVLGKRGEQRQVFEEICRNGFVRARVDGETVDAADPPQLNKHTQHTIEAVIDRVIIKPGIRPRLKESIELALKHGDGTCVISHQVDAKWSDRLYSETCACLVCGISFPELQPRNFSFNSPYGACPECDGLGVGGDTSVDSVDEDSGNFEEEKKEEKETVHEDAICPACHGARLNPISRAVTIADIGIHELTAMSVDEAIRFMEQTESDFAEALQPGGSSTEGYVVIKRTLPEILSRLQFLSKVGLGYLTLDRSTRTLAGGEFQRTRLATCLGSGLTGVCYVLDEPTIGLHSRDTARLIDTLVELREQGNSVVVVEHDAEMMLRSDQIIDLGPRAGREGGQIVVTGSPEDISRHGGSLTGEFLSRGAKLELETRHRQVDWLQSISLGGACLHNLKNISVRIPLGVMTCVTGVSGSGKSSLISETLVPAVREALGQNKLRFKAFDALNGAEHIDRIVEVDQSSLGRTSRSNPATYTGVWDEIRKLFAKTREARLRGFRAGRFSFNSAPGRCKECHGRGLQKIEMHFMPEMHAVCPKCKGDRFNPATLSIQYAGKNLADVLGMRVDDALEVFENVPKIRSILGTLTEVGLGYLCLGQSSVTLSGGEAQRVKLATELSRTQTNRSLFVLDEPTTGLHPHDIQKLVSLLDRLIDQGNSVVIVEHDLDIIAASDWVIDLGPEGGEQGGHLIAQGQPKEVATVDTSSTGQALRDYFQRSSQNR